jgi:hypothetical protein
MLRPIGDTVCSLCIQLGLFFESGGLGELMVRWCVHKLYDVDGDVFQTIVMCTIEVTSNSVWATICADVLKVSLESLLDTSFSFAYILYVAFCTFNAINKVITHAVDVVFDLIVSAHGVAHDLACCDQFGAVSTRSRWETYVCVMVSIPSGLVVLG